jgi:hypothetical protein
LGANREEANREEEEEEEEEEGERESSTLSAMISGVMKCWPSPRLPPSAR